MNRRLYRCRHDQKVAGVASGLAEYLDVDPTLVRILWILSIFFGGLGLLLYIIMAIVVPMEPLSADAASEAPVEGATTPEAHRHVSRGNGRAMTWFGIVLILFGGLALVDAVLPAWADGGRFLWPAFVLGIGALLVAAAVRREPTES